jgi:hypothetical protein
LLLTLTAVGCYSGTEIKPFPDAGALDTPTWATLTRSPRIAEWLIHQPGAAVGVRLDRCGIQSWFERRVDDSDDASGVNVQIQDGRAAEDDFGST